MLEWKLPSTSTLPKFFRKPIIEASTEGSLFASVPTSYIAWHLRKWLVRQRELRIGSNGYSESIPWVCFGPIWYSELFHNMVLESSIFGYDPYLAQRHDGAPNISGRMWWVCPLIWSSRTRDYVVKVPKAQDAYVVPASNHRGILCGHPSGSSSSTQGHYW